MHHLLRRLLTRVQDAILQRPKRVLAGSLLLVALALFFGSRVEFHSSRNELAPEGDPDQERWTALLEEHGASQALIVCVEAEPGEQKSPADLRGFTDRLAAELRREPMIEDILHRFDVDWLMLRALHLLPADTARRLADALDSDGKWLAALGGARNLADLNRTLADRIETEFATVTALPQDGGAGAGVLAQLLGAQSEFLENPSSIEQYLLSSPPFVASWNGRDIEIPDGYLKTHDGATYFLVVTPRDTDDEVSSRRDMLSTIRSRVEHVQRLRPGFHVAFTGTPAMTVEEMDTVRSDTWRTSIVAVIGVTLLTFFVFRWRTHALIVLATLGMGIVWALGAVWFEYGYLNMITSSFISTLIGVGVAYGIHPVSEFELAGAHTGDPVATVRESLHRTGTGVMVAGVTTAAAFFSIQLMRFRGYSELGLVAGVGVLLCLAAAMISLPALLVIYSRRRRERDRAEARRSPPVVDWFWVDHVSGRICRYPRAVTISALVLTVLAGWAALGIEFNTNLFDLLPRNAESLRYQRKMVMDSDLSPLHNIVVAGDLESLQLMQQRAEAEPEIDRFESVARFLPEAHDAVATTLPLLAAELDELQITPNPSSLDRQALLTALRRLEEALAQASEAAFISGLGETAAPLEAARAETERSIALVADASEDQVATWNRGQEQLFRWAGMLTDWLRRAVVTDAPTLDNLPPEIDKRFVTDSGALLGILYPAGSVFDSGRLEDFVTASRRVSSEVTGFPVVFEKMSRRITTGFYRAVIVGAFLVTLILLVDFRNPRDALLALVPLAIGVVWMVGAMRLTGIRFNFANMVAVPLIIGVGIDNGVHVVHRLRLEGREGMSVVLRHTGRAILIASLTTMVGFGSLALASHRGLASLGLVLLMGVGSCLLTSTVILPNLLIVLGVVDR